MSEDLTMPKGYIGTCVCCGIAVSEENLGETSPKVMCKNCVEAREAERLRAEAARVAAEEEKKRQEERVYKSNRKSTIIRMVLANVVGLAIGIGLFFLGKGYEPDLLLTGLGVSAFVWTYVASLFYPGSLSRTIFFVLAFKGFNLPTLIFDFDLDGCLMMIVFKLLGWLLGLILGILGFILSIIAGVIISPATYLYLTIRDIIALVKGDFVEE